MPRIMVHPSAEVHPDARLGDGVAIWNWTKVREGAALGAGTKLGQNVYIDAGVVVGERCKIQNGVSVYRGVTLGDDVLIGPNVTFTNDRFPRAASPEWSPVETRVHDGASVGANATVVCGVDLGTYCMVGAGAVVVADVPAFGLVVGNPARLIDFVTKEGRRVHHFFPRASGEPMYRDADRDPS